MSKFDMFARALALGSFRGALSVFLTEEAGSGLGQHCKFFGACGPNHNCPDGCRCNTNTNMCVGHK